MSKKGKGVNQDAIKHNVEYIGATLKGMIAAPGIKKEKGVSRVESVALSYGLSMGIGIGYLLATESKFRKNVFGANDTPITREDAYHIAGKILLNNIDDLPEHRDHMLSIDKHTPSVVQISIESQDVAEVR